jgi:phage terminase small subunit
MARPPKPIEQKRKVGRTPNTDSGGRPLPSRANLAVIPAAEPALQELPPASAMERILSDGVEWLGSTDVPALAMLREALEERAGVRERAMAGSSEARKELRELDKQILSQLSALGFDPTARARLGVAEVKRASALESLIAKRRG